MTRERAKAVLYSTWMPNFTSRKEKDWKRDLGIQNEKYGREVFNVAIFGWNFFRVFLISSRVFVFNGGDSMTFYVPYIKKSLWIRHPGRKSEHLSGKNENLHIDRGGFQISVLL